MSTINVKPFKFTILQEFAKIINSEFRKKQIVNFLKTRGCENTDSLGWNLHKTLYPEIVKLQNKFGTATILKLIEDVCDPQENINKPDKHRKIVQKFNKCLKFSSIKIDKENKLVDVKRDQPNVYKLLFKYVMYYVTSQT